MTLIHLLPLPVFAVAADQDFGFHLVFVLVGFVLLNSCVWQPSAIAVATPQGLVADPEEDYLPKMLQKLGPTPTEMEALCTDSAPEADPER